MGWTVLPNPAYSLDLAPSNCHMFGPVRMPYMDTILQMATNCNRVFMMYSKVKAGKFTTLVYNIFLDIGKSVLKIMKT
jgi:hypothetical protein